jgi:hypothetical protein
MTKRGYAIRSSELSRMPPQAKREALENIARVSAGPANGQMGYVADALAALEAQHGMTTDEMLVASRAGTLPDTPETARWLIFASVR